MAEENQPVGNQLTGADGAHRRLKKIKRPKIRPMTDVPPAPAKAMPEGEAFDMAPNVENNTDEAISEVETNSSRTDLITASQAQSVAQSNDNVNPYVLDGLPPELDYISEDGTAFEYPDNSIPKSKLVGFIFMGIFAGLFLGYMLFSSQTEEQHGLELVALNSEVPAGRPRCGMTEETQACVLYLMNCYKQELTGRNFFDLAAQLTKRETYMIESENIRYANEKIKPGYFVQLSIPALR